MIIQVDTDRLHDSSLEIKSINDELNANMESIAVLVESLNGDWQGDAEKAYASKLIEVRRQFLELSRFIDEYANLTLRFAEEYQRQDDDITARIIDI